MIEYRKLILRSDLRNERNKLFVFGDNLLRRGFGGQAKEMRGEPNAVGIVTKKAPSMDSGSFFTDNDFALFISETLIALEKLYKFKGTIIWPADDIGTGLAQLKTRAPMIWNKIQKVKRDLE